MHCVFMFALLIKSALLLFCIFYPFVVNKRWIWKWLSTMTMTVCVCRWVDLVLEVRRGWRYRWTKPKNRCQPMTLTSSGPTVSEPSATLSFCPTFAFHQTISSPQIFDSELDSGATLVLYSALHPPRACAWERSFVLAQTITEIFVYLKCKRKTVTSLYVCFIPCICYGPECPK